MSAFEKGKTRLRVRAYAIRIGIPYEMEIMGGWTLIRGEPRFIPLWVRRKKQRHCVSCGYYSQSGICQLNGAFIQRYTNACENYESRNIQKVKVYYP